MATIYGNPLTFGGGGSNDTLPPLLDNFTAQRIEAGLAPPTANAIAFKDIPDGSKIKLVKGSNISGTVTYGTTTDLNHRIVFDSNDWTKKEFRLENDDTQMGILDSDIDQWLNSTKASDWWVSSMENRTSPDYANEQGFLYQLGITDELLAQNFNDININATAKAKVGLPWQSRFNGIRSIPYTFFQNYTGDGVTHEYGYLYMEEGNMVDTYFKGQVRAPSPITIQQIPFKIHPMMEPKPETKVALDADGSYFMFENQAGGIILSADKMEESRAVDLAGAVWVYGDHIPQNKNDGTRIELTREEIVGVDSKIQKEISGWDSSKDLYARQFTYNAKKHYQTSMAGAVAFLSRPTLRIGDLPSKSVIRLGRGKEWTGDELLDYTWHTTKDKVGNQYLVLMGLQEPKFAVQYGSAANDVGAARRFDYSVLCQWVNADKASGEWFVPNQYNESMPASYNDMDGFLHYWTEKEKSVLQERSWKLDEGERTTITNYFFGKVFVPTQKNVGVAASGESAVSDDNLDIFTSDSDRIFHPGRQWWTSTPESWGGNTETIFCVGSDGGYSAQQATGTAYVRPIVSVSPDTPVYEQPNEDGSYNICLTSPDDFESTSSKVYVYSDTAPTNKSLMWIQKGSNVLYVHNGTNWMPITGVYGGGN